MSIIPTLSRRRFQGGGGVYSTVSSIPLVSAYVAMGAFADAQGGAHFTLGACQSLEANSYVPVFEVDTAAGVVKILGQVLIVP